jgi:tripartite-type tricarboxylate transporter receptor subunit TctC
MVNKRWSITSIVLLALLSVGQNGLAQESFFKGKNIRIVVATTAGGGFDAYTRTLALSRQTYPRQPIDNR